MPLITGLVVRGLTAFLTRLLVALASEQMIAWAFFKVAESVVKSTKTTKDDEWLEKVREVYQSK
jgi:dethiobiotin synthetase